MNVKQYYIENERYDWITDPRHLSRIYHQRREKETVKLIEKYYSGGNILDVCCGTGLITQHLKGDLVVGLDINQWAIERAKNHCPTAKFVVGDAEKMEFESESFNMAICTEALEHLPSPEDAVKEAYRVLKNGGFYIGSVPSQSIIWKLRGILSSKNDSEEPFHNSFSMRTLKSLLKEFSIVEITSKAFGLVWVFVAKKHKTGHS